MYVYSGVTKVYYKTTVGHVFTEPVQIEGTTQKIYYKTTVGHVFTEPVQIEGTTQKKKFPVSLFFIVVHISAARRCECM